MNILFSKRKIEDIYETPPLVTHAKKKQRPEASQKNFDDLPLELKSKIFCQLLPSDPLLINIKLINKCNYSIAQEFLGEIKALTKQNLVGSSETQRSQDQDFDFEAEGFSFLEALPIDMKINIYDYLKKEDLPNLRLVSKELEFSSNITINNLLRKKVFVLKHFETQCPEVFRDGIKMLDLRSWNLSHTHFFLQNNQELLKNLTGLGIKLTCDDLEGINFKSYLNENLRKLYVTLDSAPYSDNSSGFNLLEETNLPKLEHLSIFYSNNSRGKACVLDNADACTVLTVLKSCPNLKHLCLCNYHLSEEFIDTLVNSESELLKNLITLDLSLCHLKLSDFCKLMGSEKISGLKHLILPETSSLLDLENATDEGTLNLIVEAFAESKFRLQTLKGSDFPFLVKLLLQKPDLFKDLQQINVPKRLRKVFSHLLSLNTLDDLINASAHFENLELWKPFSHTLDEAYFAEEFDEVFMKFIEKQKKRSPLKKLDLTSYPHHVQLKILKQNSLISHVKTLQLKFFVSNFNQALNEELFQALMDALNRERFDKLTTVVLEIYLLDEKDEQNFNMKLSEFLKSLEVLKPFVEIQQKQNNSFHKKSYILSALNKFFNINS